MDGHTNINAGAAAESESSGATAKRDISTIAFPYNDLEAAISIARKLHESGGVPLSRDQLAAALGLSQGSGNFVTRIATARMFGVVEFGQSKFSLTELGHAILDPAQEKAARVEAFFKVPLFKRAYDEWRGRQLPPRPLGVESAFVKFGVAPKQKDKARVAFDKSALQAGFFAAGPDRLVEPIIPNQPMSEPTVESKGPEPRIVEAAGYVGPRKYHPFVQGLLDTMPKPGDTWPKAARTLWLTTAGNIFAMIYKDDDVKEVPDEERGLG